MRIKTIIVVALSGLVLTACAKKQSEVANAPPPPGAVMGSMAADRDGDGLIDGYYSSDGIYHANYIAPPPPPPRRVSRRGERG